MEESMTTPVTDYDEVETSPVDEPTPVQGQTYEYACQECGVELRYGGRGRKPKYCAEHKPNARTGSTRTKSVGGKTSGWQKSLCDSLTAQVTGIGVAVCLVDRFDGQSIINGAESLATSLVTVAEDNDRVRKALQTFVTGSSWAGVAIAVAQISFPILVHHNIVPPLPGMVRGDKAA